MVVVSVMYPAKDGSKFDLDYYQNTHTPLVKGRWTACGLTELTVLRGVAAAGGGSPTYTLIALLSFNSQGDFGRAVKEHGPEVLGDIRNFTDVQPVVQINQPA